MAEALLLTLFVSIIVTGTRMSHSLPMAQTQQGVYIGVQTPINGTNINYWYGIPYAQDPTGNLRWVPPQPLPISNGSHTAFVPRVCPQQNSFGVEFTESCLTLNVHSPENAQNLPVYVWIHGGSFTSGAGAEYEANPFVSTSVIHSIPIVVVTINYRLGLLGFLADEALFDEKSGIGNRSTTGNYGILDQMMALDWIKKNIAGFGGDPEQITIGGESAGGISVTVLLTSPLTTKGSFQRAIVQSGGLWPDDASPLQKAINDTGSILRAMTNCTTVQCLRSLKVEEILKIQDIIAAKNIFGASASPVIDDYVLTEIMENSYAKGNFQRVPVLIGSNKNETSLFTCPYFKEVANETQVQAFFNLIYNATIVSAIPNFYGPISAYNNPLAYLNTVYTDSWAHCGSRRIAYRFSSYGLPSYLYTYNHLIQAGSSCLGVAHALELLMIFPDLIPAFYPGYHFNALEEQLSKEMMLYWASFIRTSNPNYSGNPANWDAYTSTSDNDFVLDINPQMRERYYNFTCSDLWDLYAVTNSTSYAFH